jgi:hypothetical protein
MRPAGAATATATATAGTDGSATAAAASSGRPRLIDDAVRPKDPTLDRRSEGLTAAIGAQANVTARGS